MRFIKNPNYCQWRLLWLLVTAAGEPSCAVARKDGNSSQTAVNASRFELS
jgi:hypothetical protein